MKYITYKIKLFGLLNIISTETNFKRCYATLTRIISSKLFQ